MILPVYAGLERIPDSLLEASADLGGRAWMTFRRVILPLAFPAVVAGSIFTFSLTLGDYIAPGPGLDDDLHRQRDLLQLRRPATCRWRRRCRSSRSRSSSCTCSSRAGSARSRRSDDDRTAGPDRRCGSRRRLILAFIYVPIALIFIYSFNAGRTPAWPPVGFTLHWWAAALENTGPAAGVPDLASRSPSAPRSSRSSSGRWPSLARRALPLLRARDRSRSSSSCRSRCRAS